MTRNLKILLPLVGFMLIGNLAISQIQKGSDIDGENTSDRSGSAVSMPDANTVAIGAPENDDNGGNSGHVRVYAWSGSQWLQKGQDLDGEGSGDLFGGTLSMPTPNVVGIGAPMNDNGDTDAGQVKIFEWDGSAWAQKGSTIQGLVTSGFFGGLFGSSVSMPDENTVAVGAPWYDQTGSFSGQVTVFDWDGSEWTQRGGSIDGSGFSYTGSIVKMPSPNVLGVVTQGATPGNVGMVRIFEWDGSTWAQKGGNIDGESVGDVSGASMDMPDENTVAIGSIDNDGTFPNAGSVRVFSWDGSGWVQKGGDIDGEAEGNQSGNAVSMPDANTIVIGATLNGGNGMQAGHARIFKWDGSDWSQFGIDIDGEAMMDHCGYAVSMPDANTVAVSATQNDAVQEGGEFQNESGHVRIYELETVSGVKTIRAEADLKLFPNPTQGVIFIDSDQNLYGATLILRNILGQEIWSQTNLSNGRIELEIDGESGAYFLEVIGTNTRNVIKIIKE